MGFFSNRYIPSREQSLVAPPTKKEIRKVEKPKIVALETNSKFASVFRDMQSERAAAEPQTATVSMDWLASLGVIQTPAAQTMTYTTATDQQSSVPLWRRNLKPQPFVRPSKEDPEFREQREFVRENCKQQLKTAKRKLKARCIT